MPHTVFGPAVPELPKRTPAQAYDAALDRLRAAERAYSLGITASLLLEWETARADYRRARGRLHGKAKPPWGQPAA